MMNDPQSSDPSAAAPKAKPPITVTRRWAMLAVAGIAAGLGAITASRHFMLESAETDGLWAQSFPTPDGGTLALASLKGKPLLLNFWATWCPPCVEEMPMLDQFYRESAANKANFVGLAVDQDQAVQRFLQRMPISYPIAMAGFAGVDLTRKLGNSAGALPFTIVFDANGAIAHRKLGQLRLSDLSAWIA